MAFPKSHVGQGETQKIKKANARLIHRKGETANLGMNEIMSVRPTGNNVGGKHLEAGVVTLRTCGPGTAGCPSPWRGCCPHPARGLVSTCWRDTLGMRVATAGREPGGKRGWRRCPGTALHAPSLQRPHPTPHLSQVGSQVLPDIVGGEETEKRLREKGLVPQ